MNRIPAIVLLACVCGFGQPAKPTSELRYTVILSRHGVRSPTWTLERLNQYSTSPWPDFGVQPGYLTPHGRALMKIMGGWYRDAYLKDTFGSRVDCASGKRVQFRADQDQRTQESAKALAEGMLPGCPAEVHIDTGEGRNPEGAGPDPRLALAAVAGRIGPKLDAVVEANRGAFDELVRVLNGKGKAAMSIFDQPVALTAGTSGVNMSGPLALASTFTEVFLLEYTDGMSGDRLGWGRLNASSLQQMMTLHTAYADLMRRTPQLARGRGAKLLNQIAASLEQAAAGKEPGVLVIAGHDTNISNLSGLLNLSWLLPSYQRDDSPPGGALVFTLWRTAGRYSVRLQFVSQTMDQMHDAAPLSAAHPPPVANLFMPGCSTSADGYPCDSAEFFRAIQNSLNSLK
jgi:4-phytase/acid phosphatase